MNYRASELKHSTPEWWKETRTLYCPVSGGAGAALMSFGLDFDTSGRSKEEISEIIESSKKLHYKKPMGTDLKGMRITEQIKSFVELPKMLSQARAVNSNLIYLADYWEGGYFNKGDYIPRADFGGPRAFRDGIKAIHDLGGKIIVYLEAFIVSRETSKIGREKGLEWAMMNKDGKYLGYFHNMDPVNIVFKKSPYEIYDDAVKRIKIGYPTERYILSTACAVSPDTPAENIKVLFKAIEDYGWY